MVKNQSQTLSLELRRRKKEKRRRKKRRRDMRKRRRRKRKETCLAGKEEGWMEGPGILEILVLSLVLTNKGPPDSLEFLPWLGLQTLCNFL